MEVGGGESDFAGFTRKELAGEFEILKSRFGTGFGEDLGSGKMLGAEIISHGCGFGDDFVGALTTRGNKNDGFARGMVLSVGKGDGGVEASTEDAGRLAVIANAATEYNKIIFVRSGNMADRKKSNVNGGEHKALKIANSDGK